LAAGGCWPAGPGSTRGEAGEAALLAAVLFAAVSSAAVLPGGRSVLSALLAGGAAWGGESFEGRAAGCSGASAVEADGSGCAGCSLAGCGQQVSRANSSASEPNTETVRMVDAGLVGREAGRPGAAAGDS